MTGSATARSDKRALLFDGGRCPVRASRPSPFPHVGEDDPSLADFRHKQRSIDVHCLPEGASFRTNRSPHDCVVLGHRFPSAMATTTNEGLRASFTDAEIIAFVPYGRSRRMVPDQPTYASLHA
jgi:hypothetical protein